MKCRYRIPWNTVLIVNMSSSTKSKNHYTNLEINTKATQDEIKSAYFKLSMQYHPDKNNSDEAKIKFREISDAYEVLGNFDKRKNYDRGINIKTGVQPSRGDNVRTHDITKEAFRARSAIFRHSSGPTTAKIYDFDEWTKAHYGNVFRKSQIEKERVKRKVDDRNELNVDRISKEFTLVTMMILTCFAFVVAGTWNQEAFDSPQLISNNMEKDKKS